MTDKLLISRRQIIAASLVAAFGPMLRNQSDASRSLSMTVPL